MPTARRVIAAHWDHFLARRRGAAARAWRKGKYDAYLLMPRGARDEEFHNAITDLLSDWGSTVPQPEVVSAKVISPVHDALTLAIRDFLDRMGMQNRRLRPRRPELAEFMPRSASSSAPTSRATRVVWSPARGADPGHARSATWPGHDLRPPHRGSTSTRSSTSRSSGPGPAGLAAAVYAASEGLSVRGRSRPRRSAARPAPAR